MHAKAIIPTKEEVGSRY